MSVLAQTSPSLSCPCGHTINFFERCEVFSTVKCGHPHLKYPSPVFALDNLSSPLIVDVFHGRPLTIKNAVNTVKTREIRKRSVRNQYGNKIVLKTTLFYL